MKRLLVVDDALFMRKMICGVAADAGWEVVGEAGDGAEAVALYERLHPDLVTMDLVMPVMGGEEATRRIMAASPCPILIVTASVGANFGRVYEALGAGGLDAVRTPTFGPDGRVQGGEAVLARLEKLDRARSGVRSQESGVRSQESGVRSQGSEKQGLPPDS